MGYGVWGKELEAGGRGGKMKGKVLMSKVMMMTVGENSCHFL